MAARTELSVQLRLRACIARPNFNLFRVEFDVAVARCRSEAQRASLLQIAAEAFLAFLETSPTLNREVFAWFSSHFEVGNVARTEELLGALRRHGRSSRIEGGESLRRWEPPTTVLQVRRIVQMSWFGVAGFRASDAFKIRRSVFRSDQERNFAKALALRFPGLKALPNYPFDQIADLDRLKSLVSDDVWRYGQGCRIDALLVTPLEGDPVAAFELDSRWHDSPEAKRRDEWKNELLHAACIPLFRLRSEDPSATSVDEWYALLTDQVAEKIDCGARIRTRDTHTTLVPVSPHL